MVIGKLLVYPGWPGKGSNSWTGVLGKIKTFANFFKMGIASKWNILSMDLVLEVLASRRPTRLAMASNKSPEWAVPRFWLTRLGIRVCSAYSEHEPSKANQRLGEDIDFRP